MKVFQIGNFSLKSKDFWVMFNYIYIMDNLIEQNKNAIIANSEQFEVARMYAFGSVVDIHFNDKVLLI